MAKFKQQIDTNQASLFDYLKNIQGESSKPVEGSLDIDRRFRETINEAIKKCSQSRWQIVARMSEMTGTDITKTMLDSWTAESKEGHRFPAVFLPAFCEATGCNEPLVIMGKPVGVFVLPGPEALRAEIQKLEEEIRRTAQEKKKRLMFLREMEGRENG